MIKEFNRKNLNEFADYLYKETNKGIEYVPMTCGEMANIENNKVYERKHKNHLLRSRGCVCHVG